MTNSAGLTGAMPMRQIKPAVVEVVLGHRRAVALDEERLVLGRAHQRAVAPHGAQEVGDRRADRDPGRLGVRLEHGPLRAAIDRLLDEDEQPADVDVLPHRVRDHRPRAPDADVAAIDAEVADHVHAARVEDVVLALAERVRERLAAAVQVAADDAAHHLVGRRLVHAALDVGARVDPGDVTAGRDQLSPVGRVRREHAHPRVVEGAVGSCRAAGRWLGQCRRSVLAR